jgi:hypothetical protein
MKLNTDKVRDVLTNADRYHAAYYAAETFGGPSLYFHRRALATRRSPADAQHLEYVYATLASWGMHRMGRGGSKMKSFDRFSESVTRLERQIAQAQALAPATIDADGWTALKEIFCGLDVMQSETRLVGNSKVLHHMAPNIVPPIDREYTLRYVTGGTTIANDVEKEWRTMKTVIAEFFIPVACDGAFGAKAARWMESGAHPWDTSPMKVIDNLLIGSRKSALTGTD